MNERQALSPTHRRREVIPWWKRKYLVNRELQFKFARNALIVGLVSTFVSCFMILWAFWEFNIWQGQRLPFAVTLIIFSAMVINLVGIFTISVLSTHKIVGPIFSLIRNFQYIGKGKFGVECRFRDNDEMHYLARRFNEMSMLLRIRNEFIFEKVNAAQAALEKGDTETAKNMLATLQELRNKESIEELIGEK